MPRRCSRVGVTSTFDAGVLTSKGKVPSQVSVEDATKAAALCAANILRAVVTRLGSLDRIERANLKFEW